MSSANNVNKDNYMYGIRKVPGNRTIVRPVKKLRHPKRKGADRDWVELCAHNTHTSLADVRANCSAITTLRAGLGGKREIRKFRTSESRA